jgi:spore germination protein YaaH
VDDTGGKRTAYFETARSLGLRLDLAREFRVAGVAIWRLGDETPDFWPLLKRYRDGK